MVTVTDMRTGSEAANKEMQWRDSLKGLVGKRVVVEYGQVSDFTTQQGVKRGWLQEYDGGLILVARRGSNRFTRLTGGMFDGFYATLTVKNIKEV